MVHYIKAFLGLGILGVPIIMHLCGITLGSIVIILISSLSMYTIKLIWEICKEFGDEKI